MHTVLVPMPDKGAWLDAMDFEFDRSMRVVGLVELGERFATFLEANDPGVVHFHGSSWLDPALVEHVRNARPALSTPADADDPGRCAALYRQVLAGR